jgi:hypothetical protein
LLRFGSAWTLFLLIMVALGMSASVPLLTALGLAVAVLLVALDASVEPEQHVWLLRAPTTRVSQRGSDYRTTGLAQQLARVAESPETTAELTDRLHGRLRAIIEARVWQTRGIDLARNADWATALLPADLARYYTSPSDAKVLQADTLDRLLTRIEAL